MTPCFFLFGASSHPYIPLHFEEMIFPLVIILPCRKLIRKSFVYFKKGNGPTNFTFVNEEHPVIYVSQMDVVVVNPIIIGAHVQQGPQLFVCVCVCATLALL